MARQPKTYRKISMEWDAAELDAVDAAATAAGMSRTAWIKKACRELIARQQGDSPAPGE